MSSVTQASEGTCGPRTAGESLAALGQAIMPQQSLRIGLTTAEVFEDLHRMSAATLGENRVAKPPADAGDGLLVLEPRLLEGTKRVGAQHLGPLVAVVAGCIAA